MVHAFLRSIVKKVIDRVSESVEAIKKVAEKIIEKSTGSFKRRIQDIINRGKEIVEKGKNITEEKAKELVEDLKKIAKDIKDVTEINKPIVLFDQGLGSQRNQVRIGYDSVRTRGETLFEARIFWSNSAGQGFDKEVTFPNIAKFRRIFFDDILQNETDVKSTYEFNFSDVNKTSPRIRIEVDTKRLTEPQESEKIEEASRELDKAIKEPEEEGGIIEDVVSFITSPIKDIRLLKKVLDAFIFLQFQPGSPSTEAIKQASDLINEPEKEIKEILIKVGLVSGGAIIGGGIAASGVAASQGITLSKAAKGALGVGTTLAGIDVLALWAASDNVISGLSFTARKITSGVKSKVITPEDALKDFEKLEGFLNTAVKFVEASVKFNPTIIPFKAPFVINKDKGVMDMRLEKQLLLREISIVKGGK